jgi:hypothetical protein
MSDDAPGAALETHWKTLSSRWVHDERRKFGSLVVPTGNATAPVHRWFHLKEAFSHELLGAVLDEIPDLADVNRLSVVDPFSGVGTTLVSGHDLVRSGRLSQFKGAGLEVNPFLHAVGNAKLSAYAMDEPGVVESVLDSVLAEANFLDVADSDLPVLSTFQNVDYFPPEHVALITALRQAVERVEASDAHRALAAMAVATTIEPASRLRRDGRTLRYEDREPISPLLTYRTAADRIVEDIKVVNSIPQDGSVTGVIGLGSSASGSWAGVPDGSADLVAFSPPYPNNIDYTEVYKIELWALGHVTDSVAFRNQRHETLRSHPSVKFVRKLAYETDERKRKVHHLVAPMLQAIPSDSRYARQLERLVTGYSDDMLATFDAAHRALRPGGYCVYVVGNSVHGSAESPLMIASDVLLGRLAELAGFSVVSVHVARSLPRRRIDSEFVRESVVILQRD